MKQYTFTHNNANSGLNIYKLKLVDQSGDFQWSQSTYINTLLNATNQNVSLYPNPSNSIVNISFKDIVLENYTITVQDLQGKVISSNDILDANSSQISFDVNTLDKGIYVVKVSNEFGVIAIKKFTKI
ncbi:MAG: T9SS type A sorting domain-containing protein [Bacteroidota bacterium]|nr:T9SS type A sorting domain-containing protein [Bacteroidota bacterium]